MARQLRFLNLIGDLGGVDGFNTGLIILSGFYIIVIVHPQAGLHITF